jgi:hypothetical protein
MANISIDDQVKQYFDANPKAMSLLFSTDGQAFDPSKPGGENQAQAHAGNLMRVKGAPKGVGEITTITRAQLDAWWATTPGGAYEAAKKIADTDAAALATAQKALDDAKGTNDKALTEQAQKAFDAANQKANASATAAAAALKVITDAKDAAAEKIAEAKQAQINAGKQKIADARKAKGLK